MFFLHWVIFFYVICTSGQPYRFLSKPAHLIAVFFCFDRIRRPELQSQSHSCSCAQTARKKQSHVGLVDQPPPQVCRCFLQSSSTAFKTYRHEHKIVSFSFFMCEIIKGFQSIFFKEKFKQQIFIEEKQGGKSIKYCFFPIWCYHSCTQ